MIDGHMHLEYGPLSVDYVLEFVQEAVKKGLDEIQILDHTHRFKEFECIYENLKKYPKQKEWLENKKTKFCSTLDEYQCVIEEIEKMELPIKVKFGLEVCYVPEYEDRIREILKDSPFDFLVGAVHSIDDILYDMSFSKEYLWDVFDVDHIYRRYYDLVFQLVKSNLFTQLAHPDTIKMFNYYPTYDLKETYIELAELLNHHHMKAENNTGCYYRYHHKDMGLSDELLDILKEYGVHLITCSDAHHPSDVGSCIKEIWNKTFDTK
ncbi:MAG: histidinol-phosphatase HisJ family protein [Erysipelotrichaceae bacterium]|nr:histidinol-phosphatase HisJ family protein [Erysipelotrichaceae bacterium]